MRKAVAYIDKRAIIELLKLPWNIELTGMEYKKTGNGDKIKIMLEGDTLPVKKTSAKAKRLPVVKYEVMRHWHQARIVKQE